MEIVKFVRSFDRSRFDCGKPELNEWLCTQAGQQERADNTRTFLAIEGDEIVGYYATTTYRLELDDLAKAFGAGQRRYPVPAVLLARLAVDRRCQGQGVGARLLVHALTEIARASDSVGFEVVVVHAIDREAVTFYARYGFQHFLDQPLHLFITTKALRATVRN
ncbi:GNAT family N-acetyltransferase [Nocardioides sp.]|uniref:GNAT family N-acetyltransferase n=1 Tax=Nocardioides sp. TaxID=35761 RepID=UPI002F3FA62D